MHICTFANSNSLFSIENEHIRAIFSARGAELQGLFSKDFQLEYLWNGDPAVWGKHSPVLFPIVGTLKNNSYFFEGKTYQLGRHGFARDLEFTVEEQHFEGIRFLLTSNAETLPHYPFSFAFRIGYHLHGQTLETIYTVSNTGPGDMYFSVGGHPAFRLPLVDGTRYEDYYLEFNEEETLPRWPISPDGLIEKKPVPLIKQTDVLPLSKELFWKDALVMKFPTSSVISLRSDKTDHGLDFHIDGFPYLGIWAAKNADFVCIEPWCGIADAVDSDQQLTHKEGVLKLAPGERFERTWKVDVF